MESGKIVLISDFWGKKIIPAILRDVTCTLPNRSDVWIPSGYEGAGGYSTRETSEIQEFNWTDEVKNDVMSQWEAELAERFHK